MLNIRGYCKSKIQPIEYRIRNGEEKPSTIAEGGNVWRG
jgi:hypothetical protein